MKITTPEVLDQILFLNKTRQIRFKYFLVDKDRRLKKELKDVITSEIRYIKNTDLKYTFNIEMLEDKDINYLTDRLIPRVEIKSGDNWVGWNLGVFMLNSPSRYDKLKNVYRKIDCYSLLQILLDDKITDRLYISKGTNYIEKVKEIIGSCGLASNIPSSDKTLRIDKEYEMGTSKLEIVNSLLIESGYEEADVNEDGTVISKEFIVAFQRRSSFIYDTSNSSILHNGMEEELDYFNVPNVFFVTYSTPEDKVLKSRIENHDNSSKFSVENRNRRIVYVDKVSNIAGQQELDAYCKKKAQELTNIKTVITFKTAINPLHEGNEIIDISYPNLGIGGKWEEIEWSYRLETGGIMEHKARRTVIL